MLAVFELDPSNVTQFEAVVGHVLPLAGDFTIEKASV